jgi:hypothetical protein
MAETFFAGRCEVADKRDLALICLSELMVRYTLTLDTLYDKGEWPERIENMRKSYDDIWVQLRDWIHELYETK